MQFLSHFQLTATNFIFLFTYTPEKFWLDTGSHNFYFFGHYVLLNSYKHSWTLLWEAIMFHERVRSWVSPVSFIRQDQNNILVWAKLTPPWGQTLLYTPAKAQERHCPLWLVWTGALPGPVWVPAGVPPGPSGWSYPSPKLCPHKHLHFHRSWRLKDPTLHRPQGPFRAALLFGVLPTWL